MSQICDPKKVKNKQRCGRQRCCRWNSTRAAEVKLVFIESCGGINSKRLCLQARTETNYQIQAKHQRINGKYQNGHC